MPEFGSKSVCHTRKSDALFLYESIATGFPATNESRIEQFAVRFSRLQDELELGTGGDRLRYFAQVSILQPRAHFLGLRVVDVAEMALGKH